MPSISEYVQPDWRLSLGSRQRSDVPRPTVLPDRVGHQTEAADPTSRHQQPDACAAKPNKVGEDYNKPAGTHRCRNVDEVSELSEAMAQIVLPAKENARSISGASSLPRLRSCASSRSISNNSNRTQIHRSSSRTISGADGDTIRPLTIHGLDNAKLSDELKQLTLWVKAQQSSSMEAEPGDATPPAVKRHRHQKSDAESLQSVTDQYRAQELAAARRIIPRKSSSGGQPRKSQFKEEFDSISKKSKSPAKRAAIECKDDLKPGSTLGLDGSEDLRPPTRDNSVAHVAGGSNDEAANLWERALQNHAWEMHGKTSRLASRNRSVSPSIGRRSPDTRLSNKASRSAADFFRRPHSRSIDTTTTMTTLDVAPDEVPAPQRRALTVPQEERPQGTWARFPSASRSERTASAGTADRVSTYDFASRASSSASERRPSQDDAPESSPDGPAVRKRDSHRSSAPSSYFGVLRTRLRTDKDLRRLQRGLRSSVSTAGVLAHPELELLPKLEPALVPGRPKAWSAPDIEAPPVADPPAAAAKGSPGPKGPPRPPGPRAPPDHVV